MLPTYIHPAARCEAAAPGWKSVACAGSCMASKGPPRRVERHVGAFTCVTGGHGDPQADDQVRRPQDRRVLTGFDSSVTLIPFREVTK